MSERRPALGKGLSALIPDAPEVKQGAIEIDIDLLSPNEQQPRLQMDDARLEELAKSIGTNGVIQPILVRRVGSRYRIIAGERRWRAAQRAGLHKVPVVVRDVPDGSEKLLLELALIENIQRENLNAIDEAVAYKRLADQFGLTQEQIAVAVGKDRASVANFLRLLKLPEDVRQQVSGGVLSMGQARAILALDSPALQRQAASEAISRGLSVRETEALVKRLLGTSAEKNAKARTIEKDVHTRAAEDKMRFALGAKVVIHRKAKGGAIEIGFESEDELNRLFEFITTRH